MDWMPPLLRARMGGDSRGRGVSTWLRRTRRGGRRPDAARRRRAAGVGAQRPGDHRRPAVVADQHPPHRLHARPRDRHRQRARVHPAADRRDPAPARARRRRARRRAVAAVAAPPRAARRDRRRPRGRRVRRVRPARAADQHALRVPRRGHPVRLLRRRRVRLDAPAARAIPSGAGGWPAGRWCSSRCSPTSPSQYRSAHNANWTNSRTSSSIEDDLLALVDDHAINLRCGPVGVPNHAPDAAARAVPEDQPAQHRQPRGRPHRLAACTSTRRAAKSNRTTCSTRTTRIERRVACRRASPSPPPTARG